MWIRPWRYRREDSRMGLKLLDAGREKFFTPLLTRQKAMSCAGAGAAVATRHSARAAAAAAAVAATTVCIAIADTRDGWS